MAAREKKPIKRKTARQTPAHYDSARTASILLEIMSSLSAERDLDALLRKIMEKTSEVMSADRSTLFLVDEEKKEIWSKVAQGAAINEIRVPLGAGIAGHVAKTGETVNIRDAYEDSRFNQEVDRRTGYITHTILCMPMKNREGKILGVIQVLNKHDGVFSAGDEELLEAFAAQSATAVQNALLNEEIKKRMQTSEILLNVMRSVSSELELDQLLQKIVSKTSEVMSADRCTLFLMDRKTGGLWSKVAQGANMNEIRVPRGMGIAGHVAVSGETVNIRDAYQDARFNPEVDRRTGYHTRTILCMPLRNEKKEILGVMQVLNKHEGHFTGEDEQLLDALGSQTAIALDNSRLFEEVRFMKNYNDSILRTMATGVVTLDPEGGVAFSNMAGLKIFCASEEIAIGESYGQFFNRELNPQLIAGIEAALRENQAYTGYELQYRKGGDEAQNVNLHALPLQDSKGQSLGVVVIADDITQEQRLMSTLCRYVTRQVAEQILKDRDRLKLGGNRTTVAVLFSDIRNFTTISEQSSAEDIVAMLNDYFSHMLDPIFNYDGMLDKFIGDAIMAVFGAPISREDDAERAVRAALDMRRALRKYNAGRKSRGQSPIDNGIGITKGEAISGNIGSEQRMDYTVIGDTVNIASRLEGLTKNYEYKILVNEQVYLEIKDKIPCVDLGMAQVKGKEGNVHIYGVPDPVD
ncbi:MAG TPA: GAF domain-containing protein [Terriglobia bacterium]|nr:GAF domain-containing protein [Terriglobia bacterium]